MKTKPFLLVLALLSLVFSGCSFEKLRFNEISIAKYGSNVPGRIEYHYHTFSGTEWGTFQAVPGEVFEITYAVTVSKGALALEIQDPQGKVVASETFDHDEQDSLTIPIETEGTYSVLVTGNNAGGSFDVTWGKE